ncbi:hypothetical protein RDWZM_004229 [Blomia tropicalis]|uniref:G-protein coupled receptors family 1 profile domain-containing protein n=1 Tax=Blomia tropicalis TaxID=40697 RepID=A0A9Q0RTB2_BLOTA|nr:hypothetical protein RDWZM_004229 [Blomia tropicalis]
MDPIWMNTMNITGDIVSNETHKQLHEFLSTLEILDPPSRAFLSILYSATGVLAFAGNLIVIIVELFGRRSAANLRKFLINLAISDILFGVFSVPFTYTDFMYGRWIFFPWLCPWAQFIQILSIFITSFTLTLISIERYYAIIFPLSNQNKWLTTKSQYMLILGWLLAIGWASIPNTKIVQFLWNNQTYLDCRPDYELYESRWYNIVSVMVTFGFPLLIQAYCYASVIRCLLSKDTIQMSQACRRRNRDMTRFDFKELVTKIYGGKQQSSVCNNVPVTRSSNPYGDYESRNSSNSYKIATPNGQISTSVLMVLIEENNNKDDNQEIENEKEQQLIQTDTNC